ncbi:MAG: hypothetical protein WC522_07695 [Candidatus Omnitrophota bacterium]
MKVLIVVNRSPSRRFLVELHTNSLIREVAALLGKRRNSQAIAMTLSKGRFEREVPESDLSTIRADIILTEENTSWDLVK